MAGNSESKLRALRKVAKHRALPALLWVTAFGVAAFSAHAALRFDVFLGYDGIVPQACWVPVVCEIQNDGPAFVGTVEVDGGSITGPDPADGGGVADRDTQAVCDPGVFEPREPRAVGMCGCWISAGRCGWSKRGCGRKEAVDVRVPRCWGRWCGHRRGCRCYGRFYPRIRLAAERGAVVDGHLPGQPHSAGGARVPLRKFRSALELKAGQVRALLAWLHGGGHLIVGVEQISDITAKPWLRGVLPCELNDFRTVQGHEELQEWLRSGDWPTRFVGSVRSRRGSSAQGGSGPQAAVDPSSPFSNLAVDPAFELASLQVATGQLRDGRVLVATEGGQRPLIVTANRGCGRVTLLLFSPEREPFRSWKNLPVLWARLAEVPGAWYASAGYRPSGGWSSDGIFGAMIDTRQVHKLPVTWLLLLLLVYLVVIGPLDRYWLKRIGRPMLTWITFPCYVVLFSLLIYFIGYKLRAGQSEWNELHVVDVLPRGDQAELRGRTYASVYSPSNQRYWLECRQEYAALRGEFSGQWNPGQSGEKATFLQAGDGAVKARSSCRCGCHSFM